MSKCRVCRRPKWAGDACTNPECQRVGKFKVKFHKRANEVIGAKQHGFHALAFTSK